MKLTPILPVPTLALTTLLTGCSKEAGSSFSFGAPNLGAIVDAAIPTTLKTSSASVKSKRIESWLGLPSAYATSATCTSVGSQVA